MKKLLFLVIFSTLLFSQPMQEFAKDVEYETDYKTAITKAKEQKKDLMFVLITNYCPWCKKFENRTLKQKDVNSKVHQKFIPLILNRQENKFPKKFDSQRIPVTYFVSYKDENIYETSVGFKTKSDFLEYLK